MKVDDDEVVASNIKRGFANDLDEMNEVLVRRTDQGDVIYM